MSRWTVWPWSEHGETHSGSTQKEDPWNLTGVAAGLEQGLDHPIRNVCSIRVYSRHRSQTAPEGRAT